MHVFWYRNCHSKTCGLAKGDILIHNTGGLTDTAAIALPWQASWHFLMVILVGSGPVIVVSVRSGEGPLKQPWANTSSSAATHTASLFVLNNTIPSCPPKGWSECMVIFYYKVPTLHWRASQFTDHHRLLLPAPLSACMFCLVIFNKQKNLTFIEVNAIIISYRNKLKHF